MFLLAFEPNVLLFLLAYQLYVLFRSSAHCFDLLCCTMVCSSIPAHTRAFIKLQAITGRCRKHKFWTTRVKSIKLLIFGILAPRAIDWYIYGSNRRRGGSGRVQSFLDPSSKTLLVHSYKTLNISSESSAQAQSIGTLFK
jgi:hypothetical protein